jgi:hypothetical protein
VGNPVFSRFGQKANYNYMALSPEKTKKRPPGDDLKTMDVENA